MDHRDPAARIAFDGEDPPAQDPDVGRLRMDLAAARRRIGELERACQASEKEAISFRQRLVREREQLRDLERGQVAALVLDAVDELDRCLKSAGQSPLAAGVRLIRNGLLKQIEEAGISRIALEGTTFDPRLAEAADTVAVASRSDDQRIVDVLRGGYTINGKVVRPGRVTVGRYVGALGGPPAGSSR